MPLQTAGSRMGDPVMMRVMTDAFAAFIAYNRVNIAVRGFTDSFGGEVPPARLVADVLDSTRRAAVLIRNSLSSAQQMLRAGGLPPQVEDDLDVLRDWCIQTGDLVSEIDVQMRSIILTDEDYAEVLHSYLEWYYGRSGAEPSAYDGPALEGSDEPSDDIDPSVPQAPSVEAASPSEDGYEVVEAEGMPEHEVDDLEAPIIDRVAAVEDEASPAPSDDPLLEQLMARLDAMQAENDRIIRDYSALREENEALRADNEELAGMLVGSRVVHPVSGTGSVDGGAGDALPEVGAVGPFRVEHEEEPVAGGQAHGKGPAAGTEAPTGLRTTPGGPIVGPAGDGKPIPMDSAWEDVPSLLTNDPATAIVTESPEGTSYASTVPEEPVKPARRRSAPKKGGTRSKAGAKRKASSRKRASSKARTAEESPEGDPETPSETASQDKG